MFLFDCVINVNIDKALDKSSPLIKLTTKSSLREETRDINPHPNHIISYLSHILSWVVTESQLVPPLIILFFSPPFLFFFSKHQLPPYHCEKMSYFLNLMRTHFIQEKCFFGPFLPFFIFCFLQHVMIIKSVKESHQLKNTSSIQLKFMPIKMGI